MHLTVMNYRLEREMHAANVIEFRLDRGSPLSHREGSKRFDEVRGPSLGDDEPHLTWEHWAIGLVIAGSCANAVIAIVTASLQ
jgi:hypothetical protein